MKKIKSVSLRGVIIAMVFFLGMSVKAISGKTMSSVKKISYGSWAVNINTENAGLSIFYKGTELVIGDKAFFRKYGEVLPVEGDVEISVKDEKEGKKIIVFCKNKNGAYAERTIKLSDKSCFSQVEMGTPNGKLTPKDWSDSYEVSWDSSFVKNKPAKVFMCPWTYMGQETDKQKGILTSINPEGLKKTRGYRRMKTLEIDTGKPDLGCLRIEFNATPAGHWGWDTDLNPPKIMKTHVSHWGWEGGYKDRWWFRITPNVMFWTEEAKAMKKAIDEYKLNPYDHDAILDNTTRKYLNHDWKVRFILGTEDNPENDIGTQEKWQSVNLDEKEWVDIKVPSLWGQWGGQRGSTVPGTPAGKATPRVKGKPIPRYFAGVGWFRTQFTVKLPTDNEKQLVLLNFAYVRQKAIVYVNGKKVGTHNNFYAEKPLATDQSFSFDITDYVKYGEPNQLAVRVFNPQPGKKQGWAGANGIPGGIILPVRIETVPEVYIKHALVSCDLKKGNVKVKSFFINQSGKAQKISLEFKVDPWTGRNAVKGTGAVSTQQNMGVFEIPPGESEQIFELALKKPVMWSPDKPQLYLLKISGRDGVLGPKYRQMGVTRFGFRTFGIDGNWFILNGKRIYLMGHLAGDIKNLSRTSIDPLLNTKGFVQKYISLLRSSGHNLVRFHTHRLPDCVYDICDELGMMVNAEYTYPTIPISSNDKKRKHDYIQELQKDNISHLPGYKKTVVRWVRNLHNHPSVVVWDGGNELHMGRYKGAGWLAEHLANWYDLVKEADFQKRPVAASSGGHIEGYDKPTKTDYLDIHYAHSSGGTPESAPGHYRGLFTQKYKRAIFPFIDGEAFSTYTKYWTTMPRSWAFFKDEKMTKLDKAEYVRCLKYAVASPAWFDYWHFGINIAGVRKSTNSNKWPAERAKCIRRYLERYRMLEDQLVGYEHFFLKFVNTERALVFPYYPEKMTLQPGSIGAKQAQTPFYIAAKHPFKKHIFAGRPCSFPIWVLNHSSNVTKNLGAEMSVCDKKSGKILAAKTVTIPSLKECDVFKCKFEFALPSDTATGAVVLKLKLMSDGRELCNNEYKLFVFSEANAAKPVTTNKKIALYDSYKSRFRGLSNDISTSDIMDKLEIPYQNISNFDSLENYQVLVIGKASQDPVVMNASGKIRRWLENGGRVLMFEQMQSDFVPWLSEVNVELIGKKSSTIDLIEERHPIFKGISNSELKSWNQDVDNGKPGDYFLTPLSEAVLCTAGRGMDINDVRKSSYGMMMAEWKVGKGLALITSLNLHKRWQNDSVATFIMRNLLDYALSDKWDGKFAAPVTGIQTKVTPLNEVEIIDLTPYATRSHIDEKAGDQKGGWDDNGSANDLRSIKTGISFFNGFPFKIIDPEKNEGKSVILLSGGTCKYFPEKVEEIKIGKKFKALNFLQCGCSMGRKKELAGKYVIHYKSGKTIEIPLISTQNIADWWKPSNLPNAEVVWRSITKSNIGLYRFRWVNPNPSDEIESIDFESTTHNGIPVLLAITGE
jgi:beta-galactosidase